MLVRKGRQALGEKEGGWNRRTLFLAHQTKTVSLGHKCLSEQAMKRIERYIINPPPFTPSQGI
jgi:hypothetical protein